MCSPSEVSHSVNMPVTQIPVSSSSPPIPHTGRWLPMIAAWQEAPTQHQRADPQGVPRPPAEEQHVTEDVAQAEQRGHERPRARAVVLLEHQHRPDHEDRRQHDRVVDAEAAQEAQHPRARAHLLPALAQGRAERRRGRRRVLLGERLRHDGRPQREQQGDRHREGGGVEEQGAARAPGVRDQEPGHDRPDRRCRARTSGRAGRSRAGCWPGSRSSAADR